MAKQAHQNKVSQKGSEITLEHSSIVDDSFLPPSEELSKLEAVSPGQ